MRRAVLLIALLLGVAPLGACKSPSTTSTGDDIILGTADTASFIGDVGEAVFWQFPRFVLWTAPKTVFYELPKEGIIALQGRRARVEELMGDLDSEELTPEDEIAVTRKLQTVTGIPIRSAEGWRDWWKTASSVAVEEWRETFVRAVIENLEADDYFTRSTALEDLRAMYGTDLGYDPKDAPADLRDGADRWRQYARDKSLPPVGNAPFRSARST